MRMTGVKKSGISNRSSNWKTLWWVLIFYDPMAGVLLLGLVRGQVGPMYCLGVSPKEQDGGEMVTVGIPSTAVFTPP